MAGLNFTQAVWELGPALLGPGESVEYAITYLGGGSVISYQSLNTDTALNQKFNCVTTGVVVSGAGEDSPAEGTTYFFTVTNESDQPGEFRLFANSLYSLALLRRWIGINT